MKSEKLDALVNLAVAIGIVIILSLLFINCVKELSKQAAIADRREAEYQAFYKAGPPKELKTPGKFEIIDENHYKGCRGYIIQSPTLTGRYEGSPKWTYVFSRFTNCKEFNLDIGSSILDANQIKRIGEVPRE